MFSRDEITLADARTLYLITDQASKEEIRSKYKEYALKYHPDKYTAATGKELCTEAFKHINDAYQVLNDADDSRVAQKKRSRYSDVNDDEIITKKPKTNEDSDFSDAPEFNDTKSVNQDYKLRRWFGGEWRVKYKGPDFFTINRYEQKEANKTLLYGFKLNKKNSESNKISFFNLNTDTLSISLPLNNDKELASRIRDELSSKIPKEYWFQDDDIKILLKIPKNKMQEFNLVLVAITNQYKFTEKAKNFMYVELNSEDFNLGLFR